MDHQSEPQAIASVSVSKSRRPSAVWLVPVLAALAVGYMTYDGLRRRGPMISITFRDAEGIVAGKSVLKFEGTPVGKVEDIRADIATGIITLRARLDASARGLATEGSVFWIQQPELSVRGIASLDTLISGPYVACQPGSGDRAVSFDGLAERPPVPASRAGLRVSLRAETIGALSIGSPVLYRGLEVGSVESIGIAGDGTHVVVGVFIEEKAAAIVREDTFFWEVTGLDVTVDLDHGLILDTNSLRTLLNGAVAFHSSGPQENGTIVADKTIYTLHRDPSTTPSRGLARLTGTPGSARVAYDHLSSILRELDSSNGVAAIADLSERVIRALDTLESSRVVDSTADAMEQLKLASVDASRTLEEIGWLVHDDGELARTVGSLRAMASRLDSTLIGLESDETLLKADRLITRLDAAMPELVSAMDEFSDTLELIDALARTNDRPLSETIQSLRSASLQLEALLEDLRSNPSQILSEPPSRALPRSKP